MNNTNLQEYVVRNAATLTALYPEAHIGYQTWHRNIDQQVVAWLNTHPTASLSEFIAYMNEVYGTSDIICKFGYVRFY